MTKVQIVVWLRRAAPLHVILSIAMLAFITSQVPERWEFFIRLFNQWAILSLLVWAFFRFGQESRIYREELAIHRNEILEVLNRRASELAALRENAVALAAEAARVATELATETTRVATELATETRATAAMLSEQIAQGTKHAEQAYHEANSVNLKIEDLNKRLVEQGEIKHGDEKTLDAIKDVTTETHELVKDGVEIMKSIDEQFEAPLPKTPPDKHSESNKSLKAIVKNTADTAKNTADAVKNTADAMRNTADAVRNTADALNVTDKKEEKQ